MTYRAKIFLELEWYVQIIYSMQEISLHGQRKSMKNDDTGIINVLPRNL